MLAFLLIFLHLLLALPVALVWGKLTSDRMAYYIGRRTSKTETANEEEKKIKDKMKTIHQASTQMPIVSISIGKHSRLCGRRTIAESIYCIRLCVNAVINLDACRTIEFKWLSPEISDFVWILPNRNNQILSHSGKVNLMWTFSLLMSMSHVYVTTHSDIYQ